MLTSSSQSHFVTRNNTRIIAQRGGLAILPCTVRLNSPATVRKTFFFCLVGKSYTNILVWEKYIYKKILYRKLYIYGLINGIFFRHYERGKKFFFLRVRLRYIDKSVICIKNKIR